MLRTLTFSRKMALLSTLLFAVVQGLFLPLYPLLASQLKVSISTILFAFSLGTFLFAFFSPFWAKKSQSLGPLLGLAIGSVGLAFSLLILCLLLSDPSFGTVFTLIGLFLSRIIYGIFASGVVPISQSIHADHGESASKSMLMHSMSLNLGRVIGFVAVYFFSGLLKSFMAVVAVLILSLASVLLYFGIQRFKRYLTVEGRSPSRLPISKAFMQRPIAIAFLFSTYLELINSSLAERMTRILQIHGDKAASASALLFILVGLTVVGVQILLIQFDLMPIRTGRFIGAGIAIVGAALYTNVEQPVDLLVAVFFIAISVALLPSFNLASLKFDSPKGEYVQRAGFLSCFSTLGYSVGSLGAGLCFHFGDFYLSAMLLMVGLCLLVLSLPSKASSLNSIAKGALNGEF